MDIINEYLLKECQKLEQIIKYLETQGQTQLQGFLLIKKKQGRDRYYHCFKGEKNKKRKEVYLPNSDFETARMLAQQSYNKAALRFAKKQLDVIRFMLKNYNQYGLQKIYAELSKARKALVQPVVWDPEEYAEAWQNVSYPPGKFEDNLPAFYTNKHERVRSKTEKIIADLYKDMNVPYRYEFPWQLNEQGKTVVKRPDFTLLNRRTCKEFIHEHLGMMDDPGYAERNVRKLDLYAKNGIYPGEKLLITFETSTKPLDTDLLADMIRKYLY